MKIFPQNKTILTRHVVFLGMLFVTFFILSNLTGFKVIQIHVGFLNIDDINVTSAIVFFPLTYFLDDIITEVYGFRVSRFVIWSCLLCDSIITIGGWLTIKMPVSPMWHFQHAYALIYSNNLRIFFASLIAYLIGEFCNSIILAKLKVLANGKWLWFRIIFSSFIGVSLDTILFFNLAFFGLFPKALIWELMLTEYLIKIGYELLTLPITYKITNYLKRKDNIDYYDFSTKFNPFSVKIN